MDAEVDRLRQNHLVLRSFTPDQVLHLPVFARSLEGLFNFGRRGPHYELPWRDEDELHAEGVGVLDRYLEVGSPFLLMLLRLFGIERRNRWRRSVGGPALPAFRGHCPLFRSN